MVYHFALLPLLLAFLVAPSLVAAAPSPVLSLPEAKLPETSLAELLTKRRSTRSYGAKPPTLQELATLLWAGQGKTRPRRRTAPSAGATYPLDLYVLVTEVRGLTPGLYRYDQKGHTLKRLQSGKLRPALQKAVGQSTVARAPLAILIVATPKRTSVKYGKRAITYVNIEAGAAGQNIALAATALGLGTVYIGAFFDAAMARLLSLKTGQRVVGCLPIGRLPKR